MKKTKLLVSVGAFALLCGVASCSHEHAFAETWSKDATHHWHAAVCEHTEEVADKAAHAWNEGEVTTQPTEEAEGVKTFKCTVCDATKTEAVAKLNHTHKYETEWSKDATHHWYASACGHEEEVADKAAHAWNEGEVTTQPTEEAEGVKTFKCTVCDATKTEPVDKLAHTHKYQDKLTSDETHHWYASACGHEEEISGKAEHTWNEGEVTTQPTEEAEGVKTFKCTVCDATKTEPVDKLAHTHKYQDKLTSDETHHWYASACGHEEEISGKAEHSYSQVSTTTVDGIETILKVCTECEKEATEVIDHRDYEDENWAPTGAEKAYYFADGKVISVNEEDIADGGKHFDYDAHDYLLNNTPVGANYVVSTSYRGTYAADVDVEMDGGLVAWYVDQDNFIIFGTKWANWDRAHEIRSLFVAGKVNGNVYATDIWTDNCGIAPADGVELKVTKTGNKFDYELKGIDFVYNKSGSLTIAGTDTETAKVGLYGANDTVTFEKFSAENFTPATTVTYSASIGGVDNSLVLDTSSKTFKLTAGSTEKTGTYVADGRNVTLTYSDSTVAYVKIYDTTGKFEFYTPVVQDEVDLSLDGLTGRVTETLVDSMTGDYTMSFDYLGTKTEAGSTVLIGFNAWYVDENNYLDFYIEWSAGDRPHEIRCVQMTGFINGERIGWNDAWCDGSNKLSSDGGTFTVTKVGNTFKTKLVSGTFVKENEVTFAGVDTSLAYSTKLYVEGDKVDFSNLTQSLDSMYTVTGDGAANAKVATDEIVLNSAKAVYNETMTGDYTWTFDYMGTKTEAGSAVKFGFMPWYIDENNYVNFYVEWSAGDRPHEIRCVQLTGRLNGAPIANEWCDVWCDGSNKLSSDGGTITVKKTGNFFEVTLVSGTFTKTGSRTIEGLDTTLEYHNGFYAEGDEMTITNEKVVVTEAE